MGLRQAGVLDGCEESTVPGLVASASMMTFPAVRTDDTIASSDSFAVH